MSTLHIPPHLDNGIPESARTVFECHGVPMSYYTNNECRIRNYLVRYAPFFLIVNGAIIGLDWDFYFQSDTETRNNLRTVLWAAGILTTKRLGNLSIRPNGLDYFNYSPNIVSKEGFIELAFSRTRRSEARAYALKIGNCAEVVEMIQEPLFVVITESDPFKDTK